MGVLFFQNGAGIGSDAGWGGYTGNNNYVVRYDFVTGSQGASQLSIQLSNIFYGHGAGTQPFGFKISASASAYANARAETPDSNRAYMSYSSSLGYSCTLSATGLNLKPNSQYYLFVYVVGSGAEYYTGWNCVSPQIVCSGSYVSPGSGISSITAQVSTEGAVSLIMASSGGIWHRAAFLYKGEMLAVSLPFENSLSYHCPRDWLSLDKSALSMTIDVSVQSYSDSSCAQIVGELQNASFVLNADNAMRPVLSSAALTLQVRQPDNARGFAELISGISRAAVLFDTSKIDMSACAGAETVSFRVSYRDVVIEGTDDELETGVIHGDTVLLCTVIDSRGREGSAEITLRPTAYVPPSLIDLEARRCDSSGQVQGDGSFCAVKGTAVWTSLGGRNSCTVTANLRPGGGGWGEEVSLTGFESGKWSEQWASPLLLGGALSADSYSLRLTVSDSLGGHNQYILHLYQQQWAMKFNSRGTALGVGMAPTEENALQLPDNWRLYAGMLVLSGGSYGTLPPEQAVTEAAEGQLYFQIVE